MVAYTNQILDDPDRHASRVLSSLQDLDSLLHLCLVVLPLLVSHANTDPGFAVFWRMLPNVCQPSSERNRRENLQTTLPFESQRFRLYSRPSSISNGPLFPFLRKITLCRPIKSGKGDEKPHPQSMSTRNVRCSRVTPGGIAKWTEFTGPDQLWSEIKRHRTKDKPIHVLSNTQDFAAT